MVRAKMGWQAGVAVVWLAGGAFALGQAAQAVPKLDLGQLTGAWYEIAHLPDKAEKKCLSDGRVLYALGDKAGRFQMVSSCHVKGEFIDVRNNDGQRADKAGDGRLKIRTIWPFSRKYWVLGLGPEDEWALVGTPNHKSLWVLAKVELKPEALAEVKARVAAEGFDTAKLIPLPGATSTPLSQVSEKTSK